MKRFGPLMLLVLLGLAGCNGNDRAAPDRDAPPSREERLSKRLSGTVRVATAPVTQPFSSRAGANFERETPVQVDVSEIGSRAALAGLCAGDVAMAAVDRPIRSELQRSCRRNGVELERIDIGRLAVAVVASSELGIDCISLNELRRIWRPGSDVDRYELYGAAPGTAAFALFTKRVNGREGAIRRGFRPVQDAAKVRHPLTESERALAFVNREVLHPLPDSVKAVKVGADCTSPRVPAIRAGRYPLSQRLYLYLRRAALEELRVRSLARFTVDNYRQLVSTVRTIVPAAPEAVARSARRLPRAPVPGG